MILVGASGRRQVLLYQFVLQNDESSKWVLVYTFQASDSTTDDFGAYGETVSLSGSQTIVVGADEAGSDGQVYTYTRTAPPSGQGHDNNFFFTETILLPRDGSGGYGFGDSFGWSFSLNTNASLLAVGSVNHNHRNGAVYLYTRLEESKNSTAVWEFAAKLEINANETKLGASTAVMMNEKKHFVLAGAPYLSVASQRQVGAIIVFCPGEEPTPASETITEAPTSSDVASGVVLWRTSSLVALLVALLFLR